jgi:hypothetical protein
MSDEQIGYIFGWIGGILGIVLGLGGGILGTYIPYRLATSPRQKAFILRSAAIVVGLILLLMLGQAFTPYPWNLLLWIPYAVVLLLCIAWMNKGLTRIAEEEAAQDLPSKGTP